MPKCHLSAKFWDLPFHLEGGETPFSTGKGRFMCFSVVSRDPLFKLTLWSFAYGCFWLLSKLQIDKVLTVNSHDRFVDVHRVAPWTRWWFRSLPISSKVDETTGRRPDFQFWTRKRFCFTIHVTVNIILLSLQNYVEPFTILMLPQTAVNQFNPRRPTRLT